MLRRSWVGWFGQDRGGFTGREVWNWNIHFHKGVEVCFLERAYTITVNGIPTCTTFCRAIDYSGNDKGLESPWVALLLSKVAAGKGCVTRHENTTLTAPPQGYDSVSVSCLDPNGERSCLDSA